MLLEQRGCSYRLPNFCHCLLPSTKGQAGTAGGTAAAVRNLELELSWQSESESRSPIAQPGLAAVLIDLNYSENRVGFTVRDSMIIDSGSVMIKDDSPAFDGRPAIHTVINESLALSIPRVTLATCSLSESHSKHGSIGRPIEPVGPPVGRVSVIVIMADTDSDHVGLALVLLSLPSSR